MWLDGAVRSNVTVRSSESFLRGALELNSLWFVFVSQKNTASEQENPTHHRYKDARLSDYHSSPLLFVGKGQHPRWPYALASLVRSVYINDFRSSRHPAQVDRHSGRSAPQ